jgi:hypothetical protein
MGSSAALNLICPSLGNKPGLALNDNCSEVENARKANAIAIAYRIPKFQGGMV